MVEDAPFALGSDISVPSPRGAHYVVQPWREKRGKSQITILGVRLSTPVAPLELLPNAR